MTRFRPCIDLHAGQVKQIVGGTLDSSSSALQTNFVSQHPPAHFAQLYRDNGLSGAHVIMLGPGNEGPAKEALQAWPGGLQVGGGINDKNAKEWMDAGAEKVRHQTDSHGRNSYSPDRSSSRPICFRRAALVRQDWMRFWRRSAVTRTSWSLT